MHWLEQMSEPKIVGASPAFLQWAIEPQWIWFSLDQDTLHMNMEQLNTL